MFEALAGGQAMSVSLNLTYDATVDVAYLTLRTTGPADVLGPTLLLENDRAFAGAVAMGFGLLDGRAVGFEFQMASACLAVELLAQAERSDGRCSTGSTDSAWTSRSAARRTRDFIPAGPAKTFGCRRPRRCGSCPRCSGRRYSMCSADIPPSRLQAFDARRLLW
jgi:hypothetical protein